MLTLSLCCPFNTLSQLLRNTQTKLQAEVESLRNSLAVAVAQSNTTLVAELQKGLSTALLNQALSCRAMAFILFGRVSVGSHTYP